MALVSRHPSPGTSSLIDRHVVRDRPAGRPGSTCRPSAGAGSATARPPSRTPSTSSCTAHAGPTHGNTSTSWSTTLWRPRPTSPTRRRAPSRRRPGSAPCRLLARRNSSSVRPSLGRLAPVRSHLPGPRRRLNGSWRRSPRSSTEVSGPCGARVWPRLRRSVSKASRCHSIGLVGGRRSGPPWALDLLEGLDRDAGG